MPMQAPIGSVRLSCASTAILARSGRPRAGLDRHQALADFRHLQLEQLHHELGRGAADEQLRATRLAADVEQVAAHAVTGAQHVARNALVLGDDGLGIAAEVHVDVAALGALDHAGDQLANAILPRIDHLRALGFAHALHDDLLGGLRGDAPEFGVLDLLFDVVADLGVLALVDRIHQAQLAVRRFHHHVVGHHFPAAEGFVAAVLGIDLDADQHVLLGIALLRRRRQRRFHRFEDHRLRDALLGGDRIDDLQQFLAHARLLRIVRLIGRRVVGWILVRRG